MIRKKIAEIFSSKKIRKRLVEKIFGTKIFDFPPKKISMKKSMKIQNFEISKMFRKFFEISKFWIFIDFFIDFFFGKKSKILGPKKFSTKSFRIFFFDEKIFDKKIGSPISIPNDLKIPKIILRTACDHYKITNSEHEEKVTFFLYYLTSGGSQVHEPSVYVNSTISLIPNR